MARKKVRQKTDIKSSVKTLSLKEFLDVVDYYSQNIGVNLDDVKSQLITDDLQTRLISKGINTECPYCGSNNKISFGKNGNVKRFKCKNCNKTFTAFTNTILEKTKIHWDIWVRIVQMTLENKSIEKMKEILEQDYGLLGVNIKSVFLWKHKIINSLAQVPMPKLSGIIQIDETFFRETQKGSRKLESTVKGEKRLPRYGRRPSKYGVMGNEFANVVCMVDLNGYAVSKVVGLGKLTIETFVDVFDDYIENPIYICADGNSVYKDYCALKNIPLYVKPSNYLQTLKSYGIEQLDPNSPTYQKDYEKQQRIYAKLYYAELVDYIHNVSLSYEDFMSIKKQNGLNLSRVNQFHNELKRYLVKEMRGVSTKYLEDYVGFMTYIRNWTITNGHYPSSLKDAEKIFIDILKGKTTYKTKDIQNASLKLPMVTDKYMALLKQKTEQARKATGNSLFKYDEEDHVISFDTRKFLEDLPKYKLEKLRKHYKISKQWARTAVISDLVKRKDINEQIIKLIHDDKSMKISQEDLDYLASAAFRC